jgi:hypothetical protein
LCYVFWRQQKLYSNKREIALTNFYIGINEASRKNFESVDQLSELTLGHQRKQQDVQLKESGSGLKGFDPLCSPDQEIIQLETDLINKVKF